MALILIKYFRINCSINYIIKKKKKKQYKNLFLNYLINLFIYTN